MHSINIWNLLHVHCRKVILALFILLFSLPSFGQQNLIKHDSKKIHFGILMGLNSSRFTIAHSADFINNDTIKAIESPNSLGFSLAIVGNLKLAKHWDLRFVPGIGFNEKNLRYVQRVADRDSTVNNKIESIIVTAPIGIKYKSDRFGDNFRFYVLTGGKFDFDLASNSKRRKANDIVKLSRFDIAAEFAFGFEIYFPLFIFKPEIRFSQGLNNIHVPTPNYIYSDVIDKLRSRMISFSLQFEG